MNTLHLIEAVANKYLFKWSIWKEKRLYIKSCNLVAIYSTKKCTQSVYIDLSDMTVHCYTDCPGQGSSWCRNENIRVINGLASLARLLRVVTKADRISQLPIDVVINNAILDTEEVRGLYTEWRQVRVATNSFGKLAIRNRQFVIAFSGTKNTAPKNFVPLSEMAYRLFLDKFNGSLMLEPYAEVPDFNKMVESLSERNKI